VAAAHPLAGHLEDAELADARRVLLARSRLRRSLKRFSISRGGHGAHVDQVVDDDPAQVAQAELAADLVDRLEVGLVGVGLGVAAPRLLPELTSMATSASVWSMTSRPPLGRGTSRAWIIAICCSMPKAWKIGARPGSAAAWSAARATIFMNRAARCSADGRCR
jgi:hypothetical protein